MADIRTILLAACLTLFLSCRSGESAERTADQICTCLQGLDSLNTALAASLNAGDQVRTMDLLLDIGSASQTARTCLGDLVPTGETKWPGPALRNELDARCPDWESALQSLPDQE